MWTITNNSPFAAERSWVRDKNGAEVWLVAVKGTFLISRDGSVKLAEEQEEVCLAPKFRGEPDKSSLLYDSDLVHTKSKTDVLLHGHAYAPGGKPTTKVIVRLKIADIEKELHVVGDRVYSLFGRKLSKPQPFTKMPKHGWDPRNPVGRGFATRAAHLDGKPAPNIADPKTWIQNRPIGFGPIAGHWTPRIKYGGTYDAKWEKSRQPLLAEDFDERFHQCAPEDQQVPFLKGGELVELYNLTPNGLLRFRLPRVNLGFETVFDNADNELHRSSLHTVILEPDVPQVMMVWHTHLPCHHKVLKLLTTRIDLKRRIHVSEHNRASGMWVGESENV